MVARRNFLLALLAATFTCIVVLQMSLDGWVLRGTVRYTVSVEKKVQTEEPVKTDILLSHSSDAESSNQSSRDVHEPVPSFPISGQSSLIISSTSDTLLRQELLLENSRMSSSSESVMTGRVTTSNHSLSLQESLSKDSSVLPVQPVSFGVEVKNSLPLKSVSVVTDRSPQQTSDSVSPRSLPHLPVLPTVSKVFLQSSSSSNASQSSKSASETLPTEIRPENSTAKPFPDVRQLATANPNGSQDHLDDTETPNTKNVQARIKIHSFEDRKRSRAILQRKQLQEYINPQERLQEILKQSNMVQVRSRPDPLRSLRSIPTVKPADVTHVILLTYFRSGSTFVGDLLQQNWRTFYHFEPLHFMTYDSRIGGRKLKEAFDLFGSILRCNFSNQENYLRWAKKPDNQFLFQRNIFLWFTCRSSPRMCFTPEMASAVCQRAPVQVMKVTRLNLRDLREFLLQNPDIKTKVVYLARDPRGIISSRRTLDWCSDTQCSDPQFLCKEMMDDLEVFDELQEKEPDKFIQVLYEDIALYPEREAKRLFHFLGLPFSASVQRFLRTHTTARKTDGLNPYSTKRNSSSMAFSWRSRLSFPRVNYIQATCSDVIHKLNYSFVNSREEFYSFRGIKPPLNNASLDLKSISRNRIGHLPVNTSSVRLVGEVVMIPNYRESDSSKEYAFPQSSLKALERNPFEKIDPAPANSLSAVGRLSAVSRLHTQKGVSYIDKRTDDRLVKNR